MHETGNLKHLQKLVSNSKRQIPPRYLVSQLISRSVKLRRFTESCIPNIGRKKKIVNVIACKNPEKTSHSHFFKHHTFRLGPAPAACKSPNCFFRRLWIAFSVSLKKSILACRKTLAAHCGYPQKPRDSHPIYTPYLAVYIVAKSPQTPHLFSTATNTQHANFR